MAKTVPQREGGPLNPGTSSVLPDARALRRTFDREFANLVEEARRQLGSAASLAPHVAEGTIVRAWDARGRLADEAQLSAFLRDDLKAAVERTLARRAQGGHAEAAAQAAATTPAELDMNRSWHHVAEAVNMDPHTAQELKEAADAIKHELAENIKASGRGLSLRLVVWGLVGAAAVALAGTLVADRITTERAITRAMAAPDGRLTTSGDGQIGEITLRDGTRMRLAPGSKLLVPQAFGGVVRAVKLDGAASFEVAPDEEGEFRVYLRDGVVAATGTKFVVSGYWTDPVSVVRVTEGGVQVRGRDARQSVGVGGSAALDSAGRPRAATEGEVSHYTGWADGQFSVTDRSLREVLPELQRWYRMAVTVRDARLLDRKVTARASLDSSRAAIAAIERSTGLVFGYDGATMVFRDSASAAAAATPATRR